MTGTPAPGTRYDLRTAGCTYSLTVAPDGSGLLLDAWSPTGSPPPRRTMVGRVHSFRPEAETRPVEYVVAGTHHLSRPDLLVSDDAGLVGAQLRLVGVTVSPTDTGERLRAEHVDSLGRLRLVTHTVADRRHDVLARWVTITNEGHQPLLLEQIGAAAWPVPAGPHPVVEYLAGGWSHEFQPQSARLGPGEFLVGSRTGFTSHGVAPWLVVGDADLPLSWSFALAWCGSWRMGVDVAPDANLVRVHGAEGDETHRVLLDPGQTHRTPTMLGLVSPAGVDPAPVWHDVDRLVLGRDLDPWNHPVVYNSWYATTFDIASEQQVDLARQASDLGAEVFVVDDGWFAGRVDDTAGLGDWTPDPVKFPLGLGPLIDEVTRLGLRFGIWVEPECVNPHSDLYRQHPEWVYRAGERPLTSMRNQYVLDFGRPDVVSWACEWLRGLLADDRITYLKWDLNRPITDGGRPGDPHGRAWSTQHAEGYLAVMRMLRDEFPNVTVEACSGGGGRIDRAVLAVSDVVWTSDQTGPRDRLAIQCGFLRTHPASVMSSWVTDMPDEFDRDPASDHFRCLVAMAGVMGVGSDLNRLSPEKRDLLRRWVGIYREVRPIVLNGTVRRHGSPDGPWCALEYTHGRSTLVLAYARPGAGPVSIPAAVTGPSSWHRPWDGSRGAVSGGRLEIDWRSGGDADLVVITPA